MCITVRHLQYKYLVKGGIIYNLSFTVVLYFVLSCLFLSFSNTLTVTERERCTGLQRANKEPATLTPQNCQM